MSRLIRFTIPFILFCVAYLCFLHAAPLQQQQQNQQSSSLRKTTTTTSQVEEESEESRDIISHEIEWAEQTMEAFQRKNGSYPLRSSIRTPHVHTSAWMKESSDLLLSTKTTPATAT